MLRVASELHGYTVDAVDGGIGSTSDLLFDDRTWKVRWLVAETGGWLGGRRVLLHPSAIGRTDDVHHTIAVKCTKRQIQTSPEIGKNQPVSRQTEHNLFDHYGWDPLWELEHVGVGGITRPTAIPPGHPAKPISDPQTGAEQEQDPHLRSVVAVRGYHIHGTDGGIGHLEGFLVDDQNWAIKYLIVNTRNWWPGEHVLVAPVAVTNINWSASKIALNVTQNQVRTSPVWKPNEMVMPREYQERLHAHYHWPGYGW
jgi:hypothetical protein